MVSIIASPTKSVRESGPCDSGWRAMASSAATMARPSASAGTMAPIETAAVAQMMLSPCSVMASTFLDGPHGRSHEQRCQDRKDVSLDEPDEDAERQERNRHE